MKVAANVIAPRRLARWLRRAPDRWLHPWRRRRAVAKVRSLQTRSVLFICHGNVCRSPFAAGLFAQSKDTLGIPVDSAGFIGPDRRPPPEAIAAAAIHGVDISDHRSKLLTPEVMAPSDLIVVMNRAQWKGAVELGAPEECLLILGDLDPQGIDSREVNDPWGEPEAVFEACYRRIDRIVGVLTELLGARDH